MQSRSSTGNKAEVSEAEFRRALLQTMAAGEPIGVDPQAPEGKLFERYGATVWELAFACNAPHLACRRVRQAFEALERDRCEELRLRSALAKRWLTVLRSKQTVRWENGTRVAIRSAVEAAYREGLQDWLTHDAHGAQEHIVTNILQAMPGATEAVERWCRTAEQCALEEMRVAG